MAINDLTEIFVAENVGKTYIVTFDGIDYVCRLGKSGNQYILPENKDEYHTNFHFWRSEGENTVWFNTHDGNSDYHTIKIIEANVKNASVLNSTYLPSYLQPNNNYNKKCVYISDYHGYARNTASMEVGTEKEYMASGETGNNYIFLSEGKSYIVELDNYEFKTSPVTTTEDPNNGTILECEIFSDNNIKIGSLSQRKETGQYSLYVGHDIYYKEEYTLKVYESIFSPSIKLESFGDLIKSTSIETDKVLLNKALLQHYVPEE